MYSIYQLYINNVALMSVTRHMTALDKGQLLVVGRGVWRTWLYDAKWTLPGVCQKVPQENISVHPTHRAACLTYLCYCMGYSSNEFSESVAWIHSYMQLNHCATTLDFKSIPDGAFKVQTFGPNDMFWQLWLR